MSQSLFNYECPHCSRLYIRECNLQRHIVYCQTASPFLCDICKQQFGTRRALDQHIFRGHNNHGQPLPECDLCGRIFNRKLNLLTHIINIHSNSLGSEFRCSLCEKTFANAPTLKRHMKHLHNPDVQFPTCSYCHKTFLGKHYLVAHIQAVHDVNEKKPIKCLVCGKLYASNCELKRHIETQHGEGGELKCDESQSDKGHESMSHKSEALKLIKCEFCSKALVGGCNCERHLKHHPSEYKNDYSCDVCGKTYSQDADLRYHVKNKHSIRSFNDYCKKSLMRQQTDDIKCVYICEVCNNNFASVNKLKDHMKTNHDMEHSLSTCNVCFTKFYSKETMNAHKMLCLPSPNVNSCSHCDRFFTDTSSLEFHIRICHPQAEVADSKTTSTVDSPLQCGHCDGIYKTERSFKWHIRLKHATNDGLNCQQCGKLFNNKYYLANHVKRVHNDNELYNCEHCDKRFGYKRDIMLHIEYVHLGVQRYKCPECDALFIKKIALRKHVQAKHPNSAAFAQCHICSVRFESAKSCKFHMKLTHSINKNSHPCRHCSMSFDSEPALVLHLETKHLDEDEVYKCEKCHLAFKGKGKFDLHNDKCNETAKKVLTKCVLCMKDFSTRNTLKRHIRRLHAEFDVEELANYNLELENVSCEECIRNFNDHAVYKAATQLKGSVAFKCESCTKSYGCLEYAVQRYKLLNAGDDRSQIVLSDQCVNQMSEDEATGSGLGSLPEILPESLTGDTKSEPLNYYDDYIEFETMSP